MRTNQSKDSLTLCFSLRFSMSPEIQELNNHKHLYLTLDSGILHGYVFVYSDIEKQSGKSPLGWFSGFQRFLVAANYRGDLAQFNFNGCYCLRKIFCNNLETCKVLRLRLVLNCLKWSLWIAYIAIELGGLWNSFRCTMVSGQWSPLVCEVALPELTQACELTGGRTWRLGSGWIWSWWGPWV